MRITITTSTHELFPLTLTVVTIVTLQQLLQLFLLLKKFPPLIYNPT